jgi:hypothetical protein
MQEKNKIQFKGVSFSGLLAITFIVLKLIDVIQWSWVWVLAPIWIPLSLAGGVLILAIPLALLKTSKTTYKKEVNLA